MCKICAKMANSCTYGLSYWKTVEDRWVLSARRFTSIETSFQPCDTYRDCRSLSVDYCNAQSVLLHDWALENHFNINININYNRLQRTEVGLPGREV